MGSCMVERLKHYIALTRDDERLLSRLEERKESYRAGEIIRKKGELADEIYIVHSGWTQISARIDKHIRSIFDVRLDGDIAGIGELSFECSLHDFVAITDVIVCPFPRDHLSTLFKESEKLASTFYSILSRDQSILYERFISVGRRNALERLAHFIIEISVRLKYAGHSHGNSFPFPLRQDDLGDLLGLSSVHVNRSLNELKRHNYIDYEKRVLTIVDIDRLLTIANFDEQFLQSPKVNWQNESRHVASKVRSLHDGDGSAHPSK